MKIMAIGVGIQKEQNKPTFDQIFREMELSVHQYFMSILKNIVQKSML